MVCDDSIKGKSDSVLEVDGFHFNRIISRESSVGQSSRIYYRNPGGVPFKWEMQPGTPKNPPREGVIPPPGPPPAVQSLWPPKPNCEDQLPRHSKHSTSKLWFWKKHKKRQQVHLKARRGDHAGEMRSDQKYENFEFGEDGEFMGSVQDSRYSASSSSSASSNGHSSFCRSRFGRVYDNVVDKPFGCSPWNMTELRMEEESSRYCNQGQRSASANQGDGALFKRIFSRSSSVNKSCRLYYRISEAEGVPFKWEKMPGMSKNPTNEEIIPPPTLPPALQSLGLQIPRVKQPDQFSMYWTRLRFVVKHKLMWNRN